jgi:hypothetical protein
LCRYFPGIIRVFYLVLSGYVYPGSWVHNPDIRLSADNPGDTLPGYHHYLQRSNFLQKLKKQKFSRIQLFKSKRKGSQYFKIIRINSNYFKIFRTYSKSKHKLNKNGLLVRIPIFQCKFFKIFCIILSDIFFRLWLYLRIFGINRFFD